MTMQSQKVNYFLL